MTLFPGLNLQSVWYNGVKIAVRNYATESRLMVKLTYSPTSDMTCFLWVWVDPYVLCFNSLVSRACPETIAMASWAYGSDRSWPLPLLTIQTWNSVFRNLVPSRHCWTSVFRRVTTPEKCYTHFPYPSRPRDRLTATATTEKNQLVEDQENRKRRRTTRTLLKKDKLKGVKIKTGSEKTLTYHRHRHCDYPKWILKQPLSTTVSNKARLAYWSEEGVKSRNSDTGLRSLAWSTKNRWAAGKRWNIPTEQWLSSRTRRSCSSHSWAICWIK